MPVASANIDPGSTIIFSFPGKETLRINTGANEIKWAYRLNTRVTPTHGGEVVQILSCYVDAVQIVGNSTSNEDLQTIYFWFRDYMTRAGLHQRDEQAVLMEYPTRGWNLWVQPTAIPDFQFRLDLVATEWKITAEVVSDNDLNTLAAHSMGQFTDALLDESMQAVGFNPNSPIIDPSVPPNQYASTIQNLGDNFQRLIGAWSTGEFPDYAYDAAKSPVQNGFTKSSRDYWMQLFGTDFVTGKVPSSGGSGAYQGPTNPTTEAGVVSDINTTFDAAGVPGRLGVAVAYVESGWNPNSRQDPSGACQSCGIGLFQTNGDGSGRDSSTEVKKAGQHPHDPVTKYYPSGQQIQAGAAWFHRFGQSDGFSMSDKNDDNRLASWASVAQGAGDPAYKSKIIQALAVADKAIKKYANADANWSGMPSDRAGLARQILASHNFVSYSGSDADLRDTANGRAVINQGGQAVQLDTKMLQCMLALCQSGFKIGVFAICSNHHNDGPRGHYGGHCFDVAVINGDSIAAGGANCRDEVVKMLTYLDGLGPHIPFQVISGGVGNGANDNACLSRMVVNNNVVSSAQAAISYYNQSTIDQHKNHVHIGY